MNLSEARAQIFEEEAFRQGSFCPCCDQYVRLQRRKLNSNMAMFLCSLVRAYRKTQEPVHYSNLKFRGRDYAYLEAWGLARGTGRGPEDKGRVSGLWVPTLKGVRFVNRQETVPSHAFTYNGEARGFTTALVTIDEALGSAFDYDELMGRKEAS